MENKNEPYFSIIMPLYNKQDYIKKTITTVLNQTFQNFEIIVVNDGSKDNSIEIVKEIKDTRIRIVEQKNQGVSVARNNGIKVAEAEFIVFLDADDIWLTNFLQTIYELTINFPTAGMFATQYELMNELGKKIPIDVKGLPSKDFIGIIPNFFKSIYLGIHPTWTSAVCIPKKVFTENNIWFPPGEKFGEDSHVWIRVAMLYKVAYNTKACAIYNMGTQNNTIDKSLIVTEPHKSLLSLEKFSHLINDKEEFKYFELYMEKRIYNFIFLNIKNNDRKYAIKNFFKYKLSIKYQLKLISLFLTPHKLYSFLKAVYRRINK